MPMFRFTFENGETHDSFGVDDDSALDVLGIQTLPTDIMIIEDGAPQEDENECCIRCHRSPTYYDTFMNTDKLLSVPRAFINTGEFNLDADRVPICQKCFDVCVREHQPQFYFEEIERLEKELARAVKEKYKGTPFRQKSCLNEFNFLEKTIDSNQEIINGIVTMGTHKQPKKQKTKSKKDKKIISLSIQDREKRDRDLNSYICGLKIKISHLINM